MSDSAEPAGFWLPSDFLEDFDFLAERDNLFETTKAEHKYDFCLPPDFPHKFEDQSFEDLQKKRDMPSNRTTSFASQNDAVEDLIYCAVGEAGQLKLRGGVLPGLARDLKQLPPARNTPVFQGFYGNRMRSESATRKTVQTAWSVHCPRPDREAFLSGGGGTAAKRGCVGTGVFFPRKYENTNSSAFPKNRGHSAAFAFHSSGHFHASPEDNFCHMIRSGRHQLPPYQSDFIWDKYGKEKKNIIVGVCVVITQPLHSLVYTFRFADGSRDCVLVAAKTKYATQRISILPLMDCFV